MAEFYGSGEYAEQFLEEPIWKQKAQNIGSQKLLHQYKERDSNDYYFKQSEVGLKHPDTGAVAKLTDDGYVDLFAGDNLGIRIDPETNSINLFGENINFFTKRFNLRTVPNGFVWNNYYFNPQLYYEDEKERGQILQGTKEYYHYTHEKKPKLRWHRDSWSVRPMMASTARMRYSPGTLDMMKQLGIPVTKLDEESQKLPEEE